MASMQKIKCPQSQETCGWSSIFPVEVKTPIQSLIFIKRMMAISVSCITYLRGIFPEDAYRMRYLEEIGIKILREDSSYPQASKLIKWMKGCFDALEKKYLQMVILGVYKNTDDPSSLIESYQFKFNYTTKGPQMDIVSDRKHLLKNCTMDDIKSASISLIRKIFFLMHNLGPLPSDVSLTMKLFYYDAVTPVMYQPPGFKEGENHTILFEGNPVQVKLAEVSTSFHLIKVRVTTEQERMENLQHRSVLKEEKENAEPQKVHGNTAARKPEVKTRKPKVNRTSRKRRQKRL
ncbi:HORMA domain-containing protein 1-like isoform X2 [Spea bombifrons]|uniref:HORMA domain-containing protein 1-like isoform X2 n=1 Tax=Spea bombifrons TaxID=233779 RepID=UPI00234BBDD7|nr:HORMA domain-containing protein 1-like isoform X2 [Spea bombifrons]